MDQKRFCCDVCQSILPMFSSKNFIISNWTFRSLIYFEFIFVYGVRECSNFILLHVAVPFSQYHLLTRLSFLCCLFLPSLWKINCVELLLGSLFCSIDPYVCFGAIPCRFGYCSFVFLPEV